MDNRTLSVKAVPPYITHVSATCHDCKEDHICQGPDEAVKLRRWARSHAAKFKHRTAVSVSKVTSYELRESTEPLTAKKTQPPCVCGHSFKRHGKHGLSTCLTPTHGKRCEALCTQYQARKCSECGGTGEVIFDTALEDNTTETVAQTCGKCYGGGYA